MSIRSDDPVGVLNPLNSRLDFDGTVAPTDLDRATDAREKGRIGIFGSALSYAGSSPRVTSETIGRDINPLGRGTGMALVGGELNLGRITPRFPISNSAGGSGSSVNNQCCGGGGAALNPPLAGDDGGNGNGAGSAVGNSAVQQCCSCLPPGLCCACRAVVRQDDERPVFPNSCCCPKQCGPQCAESTAELSDEYCYCAKDNDWCDMSKCVEACKPGNIYNPSNYPATGGFSYAKELALKCIDNYLKIIKCKISQLEVQAEYIDESREHLNAEYVAVSCLGFAIQNGNYQFESAGVRCCPFPWNYACCSPGPFGVVVAITCPAILPVFVLCNPLFNTSNMTHYTSMVCWQAHVLIHEAVHYCYLFGLGKFREQLPGYDPDWDAWKNAPDTIANRILYCCGCGETTGGMGGNWPH